MEDGGGSVTAIKSIRNNGKTLLELAMLLLHGKDGKSIKSLACTTDNTSLR